jgi:hypothetical protein
MNLAIIFLTVVTNNSEIEYLCADIHANDNILARPYDWHFACLES